MQRRVGTKSFTSLVLAGCLILIGLAGVSNAAPAITATLKANPVSFSGKCPGTIKFDGEITVKGVTRGPMKVVYEFIRSDGGKDTAPKTITFQKDGSLPVSTTWTLGGEKLPNYSGWVAVKVTVPIPAESNKATFSMKCDAEAKKPMAAASSRPDLINFAVRPPRKIPASLSADQIEEAKKMMASPRQAAIAYKNPQVDMVCQIKVYYYDKDGALRPVRSGGPNLGYFHYSEKLNPTHTPPFSAWVEFTFKNRGVALPAPDVTNKLIFTSTPAYFKESEYSTETRTYLPGEAIEIPVIVGTFTPSWTDLNNKVLIIKGVADSLQRVAEDSETNNTCQYNLQFVYP
jgi:hypothetical protein